jgi:hypothetical protein
VRKPRQNDTPAAKAAIRRSNLIDKLPVSDLGDQHHLQPTLLSARQKPFSGNGRDADAEDQCFTALEARLQRQDEVVAELM